MSAATEGCLVPQAAAGLAPRNKGTCVALTANAGDAALVLLGEQGLRLTRSWVSPPVLQEA